MAVLNLDKAPLLEAMRDTGNRIASCERLRIGFVVDTHLVAEWISDCIEWFKTFESFDVRVYALGAWSEPTQVNGRGVFDWVYGYSRRTFDPFQPVEITADLILADSAENVDFNVDIVVWLATIPPRCGDRNLAAYGALSIQLGIEDHAPPFWDETAKQQPLTCTTIWWHSGNFWRARPVRTASVTTDQGFRFTLNAQQPLSAVVHMIAAICLEIRAQGAQWAAKMELIPEQDYDRAAKCIKRPSEVESTSFIVKKAARSLKLRTSKRKQKSRWFVALRRADEWSYSHGRKFIPQGFSPVQKPIGSAMADPFLVEREDRTYLFFEEVPAGHSKGRIAYSEVFEDCTLSKPTVVLERDYHLSYPCTFCHEGDFYIIPESRAAKRIDLYRASKFPDEFKIEMSFLDDFAGADTTPVFLEGIWYFFTTAMDPFMQTFLFWSHKLTGKWNLHPKSPICSSLKSSRSAGAIKLVDGRLLRPTQDCSTRYGYAIVMNEIDTLSPTEFHEHTVDIILPTWTSSLEATHTFNRSGVFEVVDGLRFDP